MLILTSKRVLPAVVAVVTACAIAACTTTAYRTAAQRAADSEIAGRVEAALSADPDIYARHIDVDVDQGVVHLGGYVWSAEDYQTARRDAASVPGVRTVNTDMELVRGGRSGVGR
ncbi:MAG TPA: BON domain-containing protein [Steroidobacteraceae bacterium]|jgi:osmotically-inducible protein OsmY|nr:BON domain-containing protein [Steroidobacteraceae bacterium]